MVVIFMDETKVYDSGQINAELINETIKEVVTILEEKGYNPINQIVGYLMSGDPGYISNHKEARKRLQKFSRSQILEVIVRDFIK